MSAIVESLTTSLWSAAASAAWQISAKDRFQWMERLARSRFFADAAVTAKDRFPWMGKPLHLA